MNNLIYLCTRRAHVEVSDDDDDDDDAANRVGAGKRLLITYM